MARAGGHQKLEPEQSPLTDNDVSGALRVFHSLEKLINRPRLIKELLPDRTRTSSLAKHLHAAREARREIFKEDIFGEPAWDILLSLYVAENEGYPMTVSSVCNESGVASTTALRWVDRLAELGLVRRNRNPLDNRSSFVELEGAGMQKMDDLLAKLWADHFPVD